MNKTTQLILQLFLFLAIFLYGCAPTSTVMPPTSTSTLTSTPSALPPTLTPQPTSTKTPIPSMLEGHEFALAYAEQASIRIINEVGDKITSVRSNIGWVSDFEISPDNIHVIFSLLDKKNDDWGWYGYGLHLQNLRKKIDTTIIPQSSRVVFFNWLSNEQILVITLEETLIWSLDGTREVIEKHPDLFFEAKNSFFNAAISPNKNTVIIAQQRIKGDQTEPGGCAFFVVDSDDWYINEIVKSDTCFSVSSINWSPDSRFASISTTELEKNRGYPNAYAINVQSKEVFDSEGTMLYDLSWSPDGAYYAFNDNLASISIGLGDLEKKENAFQYGQNTPIYFLGWPPNSRHVLFQEYKTYTAVNLENMKMERVLDLSSLQILSKPPLIMWAPNSDSLYFGAADYTGTNGIYLYHLETKEYELVAKLNKNPRDFIRDIETMVSPSGKYSLLSYFSAEGEHQPVYVIIDNLTKRANVQFETLGPRRLYQLLK